MWTIFIDIIQKTKLHNKICLKKNLYSDSGKRKRKNPNLYLIFVSPFPSFLLFYDNSSFALNQQMYLTLFYEITEEDIDKKMEKGDRCSDSQKSSAHGIEKEMCCLFGLCSLILHSVINKQSKAVFVLQLLMVFILYFAYLSNFDPTC